MSDHLLELLNLEAQPADVEAILARVHADDREFVRRHLTEAVPKASVEPFDFRTIAPDGNARQLHGEGTGERDAQGRTVLLRGTAQDVTEQRRAADALSRSEERFRKGFEASPIGMTLVDPVSSRYLRVNAAYCRFVGRSAEELLAMTFKQIVPPDDQSQSETAEFGRH